MPSKKGWHMSKQGRENISKALKGRKLTALHKKRISRSLILLWAKRKREFGVKKVKG